MSFAVPPVGPQDHVLGPEDAPVTLIEYDDYECPHCAAAAARVADLHHSCGDRLRIVWRHFPLSQVHPHAIAAALSAEAAARHGQFWTMHEMLFRNQRRLSVPDLQTYAAMIGLPPGAVTAALEDAALRALVRDQFAAAAAAGVSGTPTFVINGERLTGGWDEGRLERAVMRALEAVHD